MLSPGRRDCFPLRTRAKRNLGLLLCLAVILITCSGAFRFAFGLPDALTVLTGQDFVVDTGFPVVSVYSKNLLWSDFHPWVRVTTRLAMDTAVPGEYYLEFKLLGLIPIRRVSLVVTDPVMVIPGGHSIGVVLRSTGLVITGLVPVETVDGKQVWPARNAGLEIGDVILSAGDTQVTTREILAFAVEQAGNQGSWVDLLVEKSDGSVVRRALVPVRKKTGGFNIGVLVKDALAGVGTMTFYDPDSRLYAALGHVIAEGDSKRPVSMKEGHIVRATVTGVEPSKKGRPGEVLGTFVEGQDVMGTIIKNGPFGISGHLTYPPANLLYPEPIPLGPESKLQKGPAEMLTTVDGTEIRRFSVEIEQIFAGGTSSSKRFVVRITDPELLSLTGGIVQGMSGSPIIQDGYLVGAVTHVLVNDPIRGYGTYAEWMARESYMMPRSSASAQAAWLEEDTAVLIPF